MKHSFPQDACRFSIMLEIKRTSITRLKRLLCCVGWDLVQLEIKRTSITRLKLRWEDTPPHLTLKLEIKRTSITRLKQCIMFIRFLGVRPWNQKNLDYEIETVKHYHQRIKLLPWNQKNLDYEIETGCTVRHNSSTHIGLEIKRTSITRLKRYWRRGVSARGSGLEIKRTSITRLKPQHARLRLSGFLSAWNQKNLDYEIET